MFDKYNGVVIIKIRANLFALIYCTRLFFLFQEVSDFC